MIQRVVHSGRQATGEHCPSRNLNGALNAVRVDGAAAWALEKWGDTAHLAAAGYSTNAFGGGEAG